MVEEKAQEKESEKTNALLNALRRHRKGGFSMLK